MFDQLRTHAYDPGTGISSLQFMVSGNERVGNATTSVMSALYFRYAPAGGGRPDIKLNLAEYSAGAKTSEVIGDGKTLWSYSGLDRTYSAAPYGQSAPSSGNPIPALGDALSGLTRLAGPSSGAAYSARLLSEVFGATGARYRSWVPLPGGPYEIATAYQDPITGFYRDPITGNEQVDPPSSVTDIHYLVYNASPRRVVAFEIYVNPAVQLGDPDRETIQRIYITESSVVHGKKRFLSWALRPQNPADLSAANFTQYSASATSGWRPVVSPAAIRSQ